MADFLALKGPSDTVERRWPAPVGSDDSAASVAVTASNVTASDYELQGDGVVFTLSGGTAGVTGSLIVTVTTSQGRVLTETLYIPVASPNASAVTANDIVAFALRKVTGGDDPEADQAEDARERLADMLEQWRMSGADVGAPRPLELTSVIYCPEGFISAIKNNLAVQVADRYGVELSPVTVQNARAGLALIKYNNLPDERPAVFY